MTKIIERSGVVPVVMFSTVFNEDCMKVMARYPDNFFHLAVVDPPYGFGEDGGKFRDRKGGGHRVLPKKGWVGETPSPDYWAELFRVSQNQVVWGGNYFTDYLRQSRGWIYWDKLMGGDFSDGELAWTSFDKTLKKITQCNKMGGKIHPTEKPIKIYDFSLAYANAKEGDRILDTHVGSGSSRIACHKAGLEFVGCEIDADYFQAQEARWKNYLTQGRLF